MLKVWVIGMALMAAVTLGWYVTLPVVIGFSRGMGLVATDANVISHINLVEIIEYVWGPALSFVILLWMFVFGHKVDVQSEYSGY